MNKNIAIRCVASAGMLLSLACAAQAEVVVDTLTGRLGGVTATDTSSTDGVSLQRTSLVKTNKRYTFDRLNWATVQMRDSFVTPSDFTVCLYKDSAFGPGQLLAMQRVPATAISAPPTGAPELVALVYEAKLNFKGNFPAARYWVSVLGSGQFQLAFDPGATPTSTGTGGAVREGATGTWHSEDTNLDVYHARGTLLKLTATPTSRAVTAPKPTNPAECTASAARLLN